MQYFIKRNEKIQGPFTREQLLGFAKAKKVTGADLVGNSAEGPFKELKTVWESIKNPPAAPASSEPVQQTIEPVPASPQASMPVVQEQFETPEIDTGGAAPAQPAPPSLPTSAKPKGKNKFLLIGGIAGGAGLLLAIVWILMASIKGSSLGRSNGGGTFSSDPALLAEAGKRLQGVWINEIQKTKTEKANLLESETSSTTTTHRVLTFRFFPPQNPTKGLFSFGYFFRGNGVSQRASIEKIYAEKTVSEYLMGSELLVADPKNQVHKQYILKIEKEGDSSIEIVEAKKNTDGTFDLKIEWDQPDSIKYRGGTDKTYFYRKETAFIRNLAEKSNSCEIEWQDGVSKRFKDVEVLTDLPGIAQFTRWENPAADRFQTTRKPKPIKPKADASKDEIVCDEFGREVFDALTSKGDGAWVKVYMKFCPPSNEINQWCNENDKYREVFPDLKNANTVEALEKAIKKHAQVLIFKYQVSEVLTGSFFLLSGDLPAGKKFEFVTATAKEVTQFKTLGLFDLEIRFKVGQRTFKTKRIAVKYNETWYLLGSKKGGFETFEFDENSRSWKEPGFQFKSIKTVVPDESKSSDEPSAKAGVSIVNSMEFKPIPAGTFTMGEGKTAHKVTLTQAF